MNTLQLFVTSNWRKFCAWLLAGGALWCIDQARTDLVNGTIVIPTEWLPYVPVALTLLSMLAVVVTPSHKDLTRGTTPSAAAPIGGPSQLG